jgi:hypothetical protein
LGVNGAEAELRNASDEFSGHCLALTLLGSYLSDAYNGDIRCCKEVSERLVHDVRHGSWKSPLEMGFEEQRLTVEDQLFILMQAGNYLMTTRGLGAPEGRICYERAESLCHSVNRPRLLYVALIGQWRYSLITGKQAITMQLADKVFSLASDLIELSTRQGFAQSQALGTTFLGWGTKRFRQ